MQLEQDIKRLQAVIEQADEITEGIMRGEYGESINTTRLGISVLYLVAHTDADLKLLNGLKNITTGDLSEIMKGAPYEDAAERAEEHLSAILTAIELGRQVDMFPAAAKSSVKHLS